MFDQSIQAAVTEMPYTGWLKQQTFTSCSSGGWKSKVKVPVDSVSGKSLLPGSLTPAFHCVPSQWKGWGSSPGPLS